MTDYPSSPDAERATLSCALQWAECFDQVASHQSGSELFYSPANREIWEAASSMHRNGEEIDLVTLTAHLRVKGRLDAVGGAGSIADAFSDAPSPKLLTQYLKQASDSARRRRLIRECQALAADGYDQAQKVDELIQRGDTAFQDLLKTSSKSRARAWNEVLGTTIAQIEARREMGGKLPGLSTGFDGLDFATNGYQPGQLWVVAARPGAGKTALLLNLVENLARPGSAVGIFSAEMYAEELAVRSISGHTKIDSLRLSRGELYKEDFGKITTCLTEAAKWPIWIDDRADMRLVDVQVGARKMAKENRVSVVFVDYLQLIKEPDGSRNREDAVRRLSDGLKQLAKELSITVVALAQLNRSSEKREGRKPDKSDLRDSGAIEQDANVILLLNPIEPDSQDSRVDVEIIIAKCRGGKLGPILFEFDKPTTTFKEKHETKTP